MAITLADAKLNTQDDVDLAVIDEFRKSSWLLDNLTFDDAVSPAGGGATLTYGYTRVITERSAAFRKYGDEYTDTEAKRQRYAVELSPLGASFKVDRVLANLGPAATNEVSFQMGQAIKAARAFFSDQVINGERDDTDQTGFDGLDAALAGSSSEIGLTAVADWTGATLGADSGKANDALDLLDELLALLDDAPSAILGNQKSVARVRSLARRAGYYSRSENSFGQSVETYNGVPLVDLGATAGSNNPVIPVETRTVGGTSTTNLTDLYVVRLGLDGVHGVSTVGGQLVRQWLPDFNSAGAQKRGEVELGPVALALKATKAAAVLRNVKVQ